MRRHATLLGSASLLACLTLGASACDDSKRANGTPQAESKSADANASAANKAGKPANTPKRVAVHGDRGAGHGTPAPGPAAGANPHGGGGRAVPSTTPAVSKAQDITPNAETAEVTLQGLTFKVPAQWERQPPANRMRIDQYDVPGPGGGGSLGVFRFPGGGGSVQANVDRWVGQFDQPDGRPSKEVAQIKESTVGELKITTVSVTGTYQGAMSMQGSASATAQAEAQLLAAIVEGPGDPFFFKLSGPVKTLSVWTTQWDAVTASFSMSAPDSPKPGAGPEAGREAGPNAKPAAGK